MSNVLLLDTNFSSRPIYDFIKKLGHSITVVGSNPKDSLAKIAESYLELDYSNIDEVREIVDQKNIEYIVPGCNDQSYKTCSDLGIYRDFPGVDTLSASDCINRKDQFRKLAFEYDIPMPKVFDEDDIPCQISVIVKPVDAFSGRGVTVTKGSDPEGIREAITKARKASKSGGFIIEEYVSGQLYSISAFIQDGLIKASCIVEEHSTINPFTVDTSRVCYNFPATCKSKIHHDICTLAKQIKLKDGLIHIQFIMNEGRYWLIEATRRCPGDLYSWLIEASTGFNYVENYVRPFLGMPFNFDSTPKKKWVMRHTLTQEVDFTLNMINFKCPTKLMGWVPISTSGDRVQASPHGRIGVIFLEEPSEQALNSIFLKALERNLYEFS